MTALHAAFNEMVMSVFGGGDVEQNWNSHRDFRGRSPDVLCSLLWSSTHAVPQRLCDLTGKRAATMGN